MRIKCLRGIEMIEKNVFDNKKLGRNNCQTLKL